MGGTAWQPVGRYVLAAATGIAIGTALGSYAVSGNAAAGFVFALLAAGLVVAASRSASGALSGTLARLCLFAFAARASLGSFMFLWSEAAGRRGFVTGDDSGYAQLAWAFARYVQGSPEPPYVPPHWGGEEYLFGTWVHLEAGLFLLFGYNVPVGLLANAVIAVAASLLVFDTARRSFGPRAGLAAMTAVALWPSLVLWSALNLKDPIAWLLIATFMWSVVRYQLEPRWWRLLVAIAAIALIESVRVYVFAGLLLLLPLAPLLAARLRAPARLAWTGAACVLVVTLLLPSRAAAALDVSLLKTLEGTRVAMMAGARTAIAEIVRQEGLKPAAVARTGPAVETATPARAEVRPVSGGDHPRERPAGRSSATPSAAADASRPGSSHSAGQSQPQSVAQAASTPRSPDPRPTASLAPPPPPSTAPAAPTILPSPTTVIPRSTPPTALGTEPAPIAMASATAELASPTVMPSAPVTTPAREVLKPVTTLEYVPIGIAYALFAPFPWSARRPADLAAIVDTLFWTVVLICAIAGTLQSMRKWRLLVVPALFLAGLVMFLALAEGNVGTLFRHRAMLFPAAAVLASSVMLLRTAPSRR